MGRLMKDSGIPWIGEIPADWQVFKLKNLMQNKSKRGYPNEQVLSLYRDFGVIPKDSRNDNHNITSEDTGSYKLVDAGDFVINKMKAWQGSMGVSNYRGIISPAYYVCSFKKDGLYKGYIHYLLRNEAYKPEYRRLSTGMRVGQWDLNIDDFLSIPCILPSSISEQRKIADFLDKKCKEVDELIALEEKMIEELKAYKQSVITETVTKGLNPDVPMKDSGIEWIGQIPEHWSMLPMGKFFTFGKGLPITKADLVEQGEKVISYGQIHSKQNDGLGINPELFRYVPDTYLETHPQCLLKKGDYAFADTSEDSEGAGNFMYINTDDVIFAGYHTIIARPSASLNHEYLKFLFLSDIWRTPIRASVSGVKVFSISNKLLKRTFLLLPPEEEQLFIVEKLTNICKSTDEIIGIKQSKIAELQDYKKSIIYEYATGKKEVPTL